MMTMSLLNILCITVLCNAIKHLIQKLCNDEFIYFISIISEVVGNIHLYHLNPVVTIYVVMMYMHVCLPIWIQVECVHMYYPQKNFHQF